MLRQVSDDPFVVNMQHNSSKDECDHKSSQRECANAPHRTTAVFLRAGGARLSSRSRPVFSLFSHSFFHFSPSFHFSETELTLQTLSIFSPDPGKAEKTKSTFTFYDVFTWQSNKSIFVPFTSWLFCFSIFLNITENCAVFEEFGEKY